MAGRFEDLSKEAFGRRSVTFRREQKVNGLAGEVHRPIQIFPGAFPLPVRFIHPVSLICRAQIRATALVEFRRVDLHPAKHAARVNRQSPFPNEFGDMPVTEGQIQVPTNASQDDVSFLMSPVERIIRCDRHRSSVY